MGSLFSDGVRKSARWISIVLFIIYIYYLGYLLFFSPEYGRTQNITYNYNLTPFKTIGNYIRYRAYVDTRTLVVNILGNIVAFMPMGFFVPLIFRSERSFIRVVIFTLFISLSVEIMQYKFVVGNFDVDDIILNAIGGVVGYILFRIVYLVGESYFPTK